MMTNQAAWLVAKYAPLEVKEAPLVQPAEGEILVRNHAVAVNPVDWIVPMLGGLAFGWIKPPFILGSDLAGEVAAVGSGVMGFKVGDRVLAMAAGACKQRNRAAEGAFQTYSIVLPRLTTRIPDQMSYAEAAVIPLGVATAACGLFQKDLLALDPPAEGAAPRDQWVIVWGGATSVGGNAIQLARLAGYSVLATSSPKNFAYVAGLGATLALDYKSPTIVPDMVAALRGETVAGALAIGAGSIPPLMEILAASRGRKFIANCSAPFSVETVKGDRLGLAQLLPLLPGVLRAAVGAWARSRRTGVISTFFDASAVVDNEVGPMIYQDFLGPALASGAYRPAPPPKVVGGSLGDIPKAFAAQRRGVSAAKIVVTID